MTLKVSLKLSLEFKSIIETGAGHHNDQDPRLKTGHKCLDNLGSSDNLAGSLVPTQPSTCNHARGVNRIPKIWEINSPSSGRDD